MCHPSRMRSQIAFHLIPFVFPIVASVQPNSRLDINSTTLDRHNGSPPPLVFSFQPLLVHQILAFYFASRMKATNGPRLTFALVIHFFDSFY